MPTPPAPREIKLSLVQADALTLPCEAALIGSRSKLRAAVERGTRSRFRSLAVGDIVGRTLFEGELLTSDQFAWANVLCLPYTSRRVVSERQVAKVAGALVCAHNLFRPRRVLLLPLSWRNPEAVALCLLAAIYQVHYFPKHADLTRQDLDGVHYAICDSSDLGAFERALEGEARAVREWFDARLAPFRGFFGLGRMDFSRLVFRRVPMWT